MVQLQEIVDEHFQEAQVGPEEDDADYTDTGMLRRLFSWCRAVGWISFSRSLTPACFF